MGRGARDEREHPGPDEWESVAATYILRDEL
eukprot:CAMPEP_0185750628 /NCGR_PEP_ID=MMETSP1174-20130828/9409_1 /TAXON_ID=35687 /ORGANISM="Dictyocha speculum, Strain CCMP1381" /LENGTH=30 /DNA_ID= /DNA_START= /DNA_END= /DNA_ORIENTATION=